MSKRQSTCGHALGCLCLGVTRVRFNVVGNHVYLKEAKNGCSTNNLGAECHRS